MALSEVGVEIKGIDVGGLFHFINHKPKDTQHTKGKLLWKHRINHGMCPHCGRKLFKVKARVLKNKYIPLHKPPLVMDGVCHDPSCTPDHRTDVAMPDSESSDEDEQTVGDAMDTALTVVEEIRADMEKFLQKVQSGRAKDKEAAAIKLEEAIMQLNRTMSEMTRQEEAKLQAVRSELQAEIEASRKALATLPHRMEQAEAGIASLYTHLQDLRGTVQANQDHSNARHEQTEEEMRKMREEMAALKAALETSQAAKVSSPSSPAATMSSPSTPAENIPTPSSYTTSLPSAAGSCHKGPLIGHRGAAWCCTVFDNGRKALSGSYDNTLRVWDLASATTISTLRGHTNCVWCCTVFDNGRKALSGSYDFTLRVWDLASATTISTLRGHMFQVNCCTVFDNGRKALSGSWDKTLRVWDLASATTISKLRGHTESVGCCTVFDNGRKALSGSDDETLRVWDLASATTISTLRGHTNNVQCCTVFDNGHKALSGSCDTTLQVWDLASATTISTLRGHTNNVQCCTVFDNGRKALSGSYDKTLRVWDLALATEITGRQEQLGWLYGLLPASSRFRRMRATG